MPVVKGSLENDKKRKIMKNIISLKKDMDARDLTDYFIESEIFDFGDVEYINGFNPNTSESRNNAFFKLLSECPPKAYDVFLKALKKTGQSYLADRIEQTEVDTVPVQETQEANDLNLGISDKIKYTRLGDRELSRLAQSLGKNWQLVALSLGLSQVDVEQCEMENTYLTMQIFSALNRWKCRMVNEANLANFLKALSVSGASADLQIVKAVADEMQNMVK